MNYQGERQRMYELKRSALNKYMTAPGLTVKDKLAIQSQVDKLDREYNDPAGEAQKEIIKARNKYHDYLISDIWKAKRDACLEYYGHLCTVCYGDNKLQVHHRTYARIYDELPTDLIVLCDNCHNRFHRVMDKFWALVERSIV